MTSIEGFSNYVIMEDGEVISLITSKTMKPWISNNGYKRIDLINDNGKKQKMYLHRLIALAHIPNPLNKPMIDHFDQNKLNNNIENLRWVNNSENQQNIKQPSINNKLNEKYISIQYKNKYKYYVFEKTINEKKHKKYFKTKEEAIVYRDTYLQNLENNLYCNFI
jgi:hypothetical protein